MDDKVMNDPLGIQAGNVDALLRRVETGQTTETDAEQLRRLQGAE